MIFLHFREFILPLKFYKIDQIKPKEKKMEMSIVFFNVRLFVKETWSLMHKERSVYNFLFLFKHKKILNIFNLFG